ncbi:hypothetical protein GCM10027589_33770 [Actinocorallia lasiicapitis]
MPCGAATVSEDSENGTLVSDRFAASAPWTIAAAMPPTIARDGIATIALRRQRVTPLSSASCMWLLQIAARRADRDNGP